MGLPFAFQFTVIVVSELAVAVNPEGGLAKVTAEAVVELALFPAASFTKVWNV